ncbi:FAD-linked oxidase [Sphingopyxis sp. H050]|jgi:4-cresol dehydrogenase (hydroxylating) flavoprotein subunit|uniref:FAD-binding oxidoreductase n=1 Tax=Sphingopyxis sp. H050 TaxID=1759072 RepID=UPI0007364EDE|nr:FAD-binding protein [Sphingopyxis sp. H050]KTE22777.1 FAD-linked oxidase [Sphingopyxis sp. H050]
MDATRQAAAVNAIEASVGGASLTRDPAMLEPFRSGRNLPIAIVAPAGEEELSRILAAARSAGAALQPASRAAPGRDAAARDKIIILDLSRMNKILEVNEELAYCLVEPGVTFQQLSEHISERGLRLGIDCPGDPDESVADAFIQRRAGYTPYADHYLMQCGLEVMLADGRSVRTGMGAMPKSTCWQLFKFGYGPWVDGLFTQSDLGIVTKVGLWLMPSPPAAKPFAVTVPGEDDLAALFDVLGPLKTNMVVPNGVAVANALHEAALAGKTRRDFAGSGPMKASEIGKAGASLGLGYWTLYGSLYGLPENVSIAWSMISDAFSSINGARILSGTDFANRGLWDWRAGMMSGSVGAPPGRVPAWAGGSSMRVSPVSPVDGADVLRLYELSRDAAGRHGFDLLTEANAIWRSAQHLQHICWNGSSEGNAKVRTCAQEIIEAQASAGFGQTHVEASLAGAARASYESGATAQLHARVKRALDPANLFVSA